ncbi:TIGR00730 family Rossman fold protein [Vibrio gazogenes]|uniref:Cytokinin riboside 5'-monophosphate phosphoribohydrolase n=1 Tax=Vibrio gazogenes DSM 21264 = NBRC 103151 TaxID=1123492 RepID=A0A1M5HFH9_VIBGA|nr:TIGR00730 family Rossman fold protein [Vibrio gazogenes]USP13593.1 TIGR00730 family Rossman fold protein [Vibrio gazogenes]SHG14691.1 hypothetical protein SAMN02745781_04086 [Vibrio gazogenes DSM 21264] [Vibrio gazogenes DSM 21264 = NBRC 103151]SJN55616.1 LOG family protein YvdD [Vibrio gazogenes]
MRIAVFCGSNHGVSPEFMEETKALAREMAKRNADLVYGGGKVGLMGTLADEAISSAVHVIGVMPQSLVDYELAHPDIDELIIVSDMHSRKALMAEHADAFIALPGGTGTLEEIFEAWTWAQLGLHSKPCGFLNINGYFDELLIFFEKIIASGFMKEEYASMLTVSDNVGDLLDNIVSYTPPVPKWQQACIPESI